MKNKNKCNHQYKAIKTKIKKWDTHLSGTYSCNSLVKMDIIENFYLYCEKCGNIIKNEEDN